MNAGLLELKLPWRVTPVAIAEDEVLVIVMEHLVEIDHLFRIVFSTYNRWFELARWTFSDHKKASMLITSRKGIKTITCRSTRNQVPRAHSICDRDDLQST